MTFKSATQPFCRCCGKPIRKWTQTLYIYPEPPRTHTPVMRRGDPKNGEDQFKDYPTGEMSPIHVARHVVAPYPKTKAEAQKLTNEKVVSVVRSLEGDNIREVGTWDGETYADEFFCSGKCAQEYGYLFAHLHGTRHTIETKKYAAAIAKAKGGVK